MIDTFSIKKHTQIEKNASKVNFFYIAGTSEHRILFAKLEVDRFFLGLLYFRSWRAQRTQLSGDEIELKSTSAYISRMH